MTEREQQCRTLWFKAVHKRDRCCQICGVAYSVEAHHLLGRSNWPIAYNVKFGVCLCPKHHRMFDSAAAQRAEAWDKFIGRLELTDPERTALIIKTKESPPPLMRNPDWDDVLAWVKDQYLEIEKDAAWTDDIEPTYRSTII